VCGIVGYVGRRTAGPQVQELLLAGLSKLEYRGYDSAGISVIAGERIEAVRAVGNLSALRAKLEQTSNGRGGAVALAERPATTGIGHTRWATHGRVSEENAHPHYDTGDRVHVVVNGIVENYMTLKDRLSAQGSVFTSETDAEVIAHLIAELYAGDLVEAVRGAYAQLEGHYAFVAMSLDEPELLVGARKECPLIVGRGEGEQFIASAVPAFLAETRRVQFVENGELVVLRPEGVTLTTADGMQVERPEHTVDWDEETAEKGGFDTFMIKEINEQADAVADAISDRTARGDGVDLQEQDALDESVLEDVKRIVIVACGTSYHAGLIGRYAIEEWARVPRGRPRGSGARHHPVGRDRRHACSDAPGPRARCAGAGRDQRDGLPGHARLRRRSVYAGRSRDRRGGDQDVPLSGGRDVPAGAAPGRAAGGDRPCSTG
jgi:glucosamine--fructose-6-phosphate aminotransferase (isomerizing)